MTSLRVGLQDEQKEAAQPNPWADKKDYEAIFRSIFLLEKTVKRIMM